MNWILCRELLLLIAKCRSRYPGTRYPSHPLAGKDITVLVNFYRSRTQKRLYGSTMGQPVNRCPQQSRQTSKAFALLYPNTQHASPKKGIHSSTYTHPGNIQLPRRSYGVSQPSAQTPPPTTQSLHSASTNRLANRPKTGTSYRSSISTTLHQHNSP